MSGLVLLDTNVASWSFERSEHLEPYVEDLRGKRVALSFQTVAEMRVGARLDGWGERRTKDLNRFFAHTSRIGFDERVGAAWVEVIVRGVKIGRRMDGRDAWVAAVALVHKATLVTDDNDFVALKMPGLRVVCHAPPP